MDRLLIIGTAVILDWLLGDPYWLPHPIRGIGWLINRLESAVKGFRINQKWQGFILWIGVVGASYITGLIILKGLALVHPYARMVGEILMIYTCLAARCLDQETRKVMVELKRDNLKEGRRLLNYLVGRETDDLSREEVIRASVETVAENTVDGLISPLVYAFIGGGGLALAYKAVNTLDSMVGYKNQQYRELGWASARLDDLFNYIPARLTGLLIPVAAFFYNGQLVSGLKIMVRDRRNSSSPNAGYPEAAVAGSLRIQLGGPSYYFGQLVEKPTIGDPDRRLKPEHILDSIRLMYLTQILVVLICSGLYLLFKG